jgi:hypothetical protein
LTRKRKLNALQSRQQLDTNQSNGIIMKNTLLKTLVLVMTVAGIMSLTGCNEANSAPSGAPAVTEAASNNATTAQDSAVMKAPATADANEHKADAEAGNELY